MVELPTARVPPGAKETGVPEMVTAVPPGVSIVPAIAKPAGSAVNVCPATTKTDCVADAVLIPRLIVEEPICKCDEASRETSVPDRYTELPPGVSEDPAIGKPVGAAVKVWPATMKTSGPTVSGLWPRPMVEEPICSCEKELRDIAVPEIVTAWPPGDMVVPAIENPVGAAVNVWPATLKIDWGADGKEGRAKVLAPLTKSP